MIHIIKAGFILVVAIYSLPAMAQSTSPLIRANFGTEADLKANYFNGAVSAGNDDWYKDVTGTGRQVIDTTGAAAMVARLATDTAFRKLPFYRKMAVDPYSALNGALWIDAIMVRDHAGYDTSAYLFSNKNGQSPGLWTGGLQPVPDKNDIGDIYAHIRRDGTTLSDPLWFFGGISLMGTTGNRYFDFELYQSNLIYDMASARFINHGSDSGHTSWKFDASGNVTQPGDIIFTAEYGSTGLTFLEARIWIRGSDTLTVSPSRFNWAVGKYDGDGLVPAFGYKSIIPRVAGDFYSGTQSAANTWAGPFGMVNNMNAFQTEYTNRQFMEISVNLTRLGLDPIDLLGTGNCNMPFSKIVVKTRSATAFSSELKDFVGPFSLFAPTRVDIASNLPFLCDTNSAGDLWVRNSLTTSIYTWSTDTGSIVGPTTGTNIQVNKAGTYVVQQRLYAGCTPYASDTISISYYNSYLCTPLAVQEVTLTGNLQGRQARLAWSAAGGSSDTRYVLERSIDGSFFSTVMTVSATNDSSRYYRNDDLEKVRGMQVRYRLRIHEKSGRARYSKTILFSLSCVKSLITPNPSSGAVQFTIETSAAAPVTIQVVDAMGRAVYSRSYSLQKGTNTIPLDLSSLHKGVYQVVCSGMPDRSVRERLVIR